MKQKTIGGFILCLITALFSCSQSDNKTSTEKGTSTSDTAKNVSVGNQVDANFEKTWTAFANAVKTSDFNALKSLSTDCIRCTECLYNTDKESEEYEKMKDKLTIDQYDSVDAQLKYYGFDKFIKEDFSIIFNEDVKLCMANSKNITITDNAHNRNIFTNVCIADKATLKNSKLIEVNVDIVSDRKYPNSDEEQHGWTASFEFIETKDGYKFCGYSATP